MWIQLEVAYRQWWLEAEGRQPRLVIEEVSAKSDKIFLYIRNIGSSPIYEIHVLIPSPEEYRKYSVLLERKTRMIRDLIDELAPCIIVKYVNLAPGKGETLHITREELEGCHNVDGVVALILCHNDPVADPESCRVIVRWHTGKDTVSVTTIYREIPGILTRIPDMITSVYAYYRYYKRSRKLYSTSPPHARG